MLRQELGSFLPPHEYRRFDHTEERIPTPVDDRGIVKVGALIAIVQQTIEPEYQWAPRVNTHHFYWPRSATKGWDIHKQYIDFRGLAVNKGWLPVDFHAWLHAITLPPAVPEKEVMVEREAAFELALKALRHATSYVRLSTGLTVIEQNDRIDNYAVSTAYADSLRYSADERQFLHESLNAHFERYLETLFAMTEHDPTILPDTTMNELLEEEAMEAHADYLRRLIGCKALDYSDLCIAA